MTVKTCLKREQEHWHGSFEAMAGLCEVLLEVASRPRAEALLAIAEQEARRIEQKFSRYREGNPINIINTAAGKPVEVDEEMANLLDFADECHRLSNGMFDVTSGVLRRVWKFDGSDRLPNPVAVKKLMPLVGWKHVHWKRPVLQLQQGMEIDLGGIGKEYAVDRVALLLRERSQDSCLVNFGGDLAVTRPRAGGREWRVAIEMPESATLTPMRMILIRKGGLATSGDARRYLLRKGKRYSHVLDPHTGWPVDTPFHSVTVAAPTCTQAGMLATFALLKGRQAKAFLKKQGVHHWIL